MKKESVWAFTLALAVAISISVWQFILSTPSTIDGLAAITAVDGGKTWSAVYQDNDVVFYLFDGSGVIQKQFSVSRKSGDLLLQIPFMTTDLSGKLYYIKQYTDSTNGKYDQKQELAIYTPEGLSFLRTKTVRLDAGQEGEQLVLYNNISISTSLTVTGVSEDGTGIYRKTYDIDTLKDTKSAAVKNEREYPAAPNEGIYKVVTAGSDIVYLSKTGKVFLSKDGEDAPTLLYPKEQTGTITYTSFLAENDVGQVIVGEQPSGNIMRIFTKDDGAEFLGEGGQGFGTTSYTCKDALDMSFTPSLDGSYAVVVENKTTKASEIVVCNKGFFTVIDRVRNGIISISAQVFSKAVLYFIGLSIIIVILMLLQSYIINSRTIMVKLMFASVPILIIAVGMFGTYSYFSYQSALSSTYSAKVADQGNLLRALFSSTSFDKITSPQMYTSTEYKYLRAQMATRDVYTSSAYFVGGNLYTGVDNTLPSLYPFGIRKSTQAQQIYKNAALSGKQQTGTISDAYGERIACITPIGSSSGNTVFLLETSIFTAELKAESAGFIRNYVILSLLGIAGALVLLLILFRKILSPLDGIRTGLEQFSKGDRTVRLVGSTNDELADIARVFNKMAKDIDIQIYNLKAMGETYYRFVPQQIFRLLGKDNMADIQLGSAVRGQYCVMVAQLNLRQNEQDYDEIQVLTNLFFATLHQVSGENDCTLISDSANLRSLRIICPNGDTAVKSAMVAIALIDSHNAKSLLLARMDVNILLHYTPMGFGICGDSERFMPAMLSSGLDRIIEQCEDFRKISSRLLVTQQAYQILGASDYLHRFVGYADDEQEVGLYDFYDSCSASLTKLFTQTKNTFDKATELYHLNRYYDAKNLFAVVLRENQYDNIARHYIFLCEKKL